MTEENSPEEIPVAESEDSEQLEVSHVFMKLVGGPIPEIRRFASFDDDPRFKTEDGSAIPELHYLPTGLWESLGRPEMIAVTIVPIATDVESETTTESEQSNG